jgi:glycine amidinotransferase
MKSDSITDTYDNDHKGSNAQRIQVHYEWGTLKEVVVGIPYFRIPEELPDYLKNFYPVTYYRFLDENRGKTIEQADPTLYGKMTEQMNAAIEILRNHGIKVHRPEELNQAEQKYLDDQEYTGGIQLFPRDPMLVIGDNFIETEPLGPLRRRERFGIRRAIYGRLLNSNAKVVSMPPALPSDNNKETLRPSPILEGGDVFVMGKDIYVGVSGNGSNAEGVEWLQQYLGSEYTVQKIELTSKFLHLDCCLATPRKGLAIVCCEAFEKGLPEFLRDWQLIELPIEQACERMGCNGLILDENTILIHTDLPDLVKKLENAGQKVITTPFDAIYRFSGAFRCWHHPLVRESSVS